MSADGQIQRRWNVECLDPLEDDGGEERRSVVAMFDYREDANEYARSRMRHSRRFKWRVVHNPRHDTIPHPPLARLCGESEENA